MDKFDEEFKEKYPLCYAAGEDGNAFRETELRELVYVKCNKTVTPRLMPRQIEILKKLENGEELTPLDIHDCQLIQNLPGEEWKPIDVNPNYMISSLGRVKSLARSFIDAANQFHPITEKIITRGIHRSGYAIVDIRVPHHSKFVHKYVADAFIPITDEDIRLNRTDINHIDGDKLNSMVVNLERNNRSENIRHAYAHNLNMAHDETHFFAKLTNKQVAECRLRAKQGEFVEDLAIEFGISTSEMTGIINGTYYKGVNSIETPYISGSKRSSGFNASNAKFTKEQVIEIRNRRANGETVVSLAKEFGVKRHTISDICNGKTYKDLDQLVRVRKYDPKPIVYNPNNHYKHSPEDFLKAEDMMNNGMSIRSVAREFGVDHKTVRYWLEYAKQIRNNQSCKENKHGNNPEV